MICIANLSLQDLMRPIANQTSNDITVSEHRTLDMIVKNKPGGAKYDCIMEIVTGTNIPCSEYTVSDFLNSLKH